MGPAGGVALDEDAGGARGGWPRLLSVSGRRQHEVRANAVCKEVPPVHTLHPQGVK
jgi:hypothetical protein